MIKKIFVTATGNRTREGLERPARVRIFSLDKSELEQRIKDEIGRGWELVSRSYSMDDGHGAELGRKQTTKTN